MICPYYKNKEVFDGFNEIIEALGGKPMTEEEFRSADLRNLRTGRDFSAMEAAYVIYDKNGGNLLDKAPNGKPSILFQTLLDLNGGNRVLAILLKSNVYSDAFFDWFGDWINNKDNSSKVIDENGEPLVVYHGTNKKFSEFKKEYVKAPRKTPLFNVDPELDKAFYFSSSREYAEIRGNSLPVYLSIKNPFSKETIDKIKEDNPDIKLFEFDIAYDDFFEDGKFLLHTSTVASAFVMLREFGIQNVDGIIGIDILETDHDSDFAIRNSNLAKHIRNLGTFDSEVSDIYHIPIIRTVQNGQQFEDADLSFFGTDVMSRLLNGDEVTSDELVQQLLLNESLSFENERLAEILLRHKIQVKLDDSIGNFYLATTETNKTTGQSIILINPKLINKVTKGYLGETILHEVVHAVTVNAINNPSNSFERNFVLLNKKVFSSLSKLFPEHSAIFNNTTLGLYALNNEKEFAAVFITDDEARRAFYTLAKQLDIKSNGRFINTFKNFINSVVHLFVNKNIFNTNLALLEQYQKSFLAHLYNIPTQKSANVSKKLLSELYDLIGRRSVFTESLIDKMKEVLNYADAVERNNMIRIQFRRNNSKEDHVYGFDDIEKALQIRINALKTSDLNQYEKNKYITDTKTQLSMFLNQQTVKYIAITSALRSIVPQLLTDLRWLKNINIDGATTLSGSEYMYHSHSNFNMYLNVATAMEGLLEQTSTRQSIIDEYNNGVPADQKITYLDIEELKHSVQNVKSIAGEGMVILQSLRNRTTFNILRQLSQKEGALDIMEEYIENVTENPLFNDDISWFTRQLGAMDAASNDALRMLSNIINRALKKADNAVIDKTTRLLELQSKLKFGESVLDLYETDDNGLTTGFLKRRLNFGKFYRDYDRQIVRINETISRITGKLLNSEDRIAPDDDTIISDESAKSIGLQTEKKTFDENGKLIKTEHIEWSVRLAWNELKNKWLDEHCERKYNKIYYNAWNKVPQIAKDALSSINAEIQSILLQPGILGNDGYYHYDKLSDEDWDSLQKLWIDKKLLRSDYDRFGNLKKEGTSEYKIAKSLLQLNKDLYGDDSSKIKKDLSAWKKALNDEIKNCGGIDAYNKWKNKEENRGFDIKRFRKWHSRNSRLEFKKDANGNAIIFNDIEDAMLGFRVDYGKKYEQLKDQADLLLKPYRSQSGEINASQIPESVINILKEIYSKQYLIRKEVYAKNPAIRSIAEKYKEVFDEFIVFKDTEYYKQIKKQIQAAATDEQGILNVELQEALLSAYGTTLFDYTSGMYMGFKPYRWMQRMQARDVEKYMEYTPGDAWTERVDDQRLLNTKYSELVQKEDIFAKKHGLNTYGDTVSMIPKESLYENKSFSKIENSPTLMSLYREVVNTMKESNDMLINRQYVDNFLLPQQTGSIWKRMKKHSAWGRTNKLIAYDKETFGESTFMKLLQVRWKSSKLKVLIDWAIESLGFGYNPNDFSQLGSNQALDETDDEGNTRINKTPLSGKYPDGRTFHILPQYYTRRMQDPSQISSDLVRIISNYYKMSNYYKQKVAIKDDCETIVDFLQWRDEKRLKSRRNLSIGQDSDDSNVTSAAKKFLEMNLYDMRRSNIVLEKGPITFQWSKAVGLWKNWATSRNLGMNPKVALTGFLTSIAIHNINMITGQNYGHEGFVAYGEVIRRIFQSGLGARYVGNPLSNDDMMVMAENFDIAGQAERKWEGTHRNRLVLAGYKNSIFGFMSTADFISKSIIMVATLMNHHYVDGKFLSRDDIRLSRYLYQSKEEYKQALKRWKSGPNLYTLLKAKNHDLVIDVKENQKYVDEYNKNNLQKISLLDFKKAFDSCYDVIKDRVQKPAEYADGMATQLQKAAITQSILGCLVLIHRQYLPLIGQRYLGKRVYDYDMHLWKPAVFRTLFDIVGQIMQNNIVAGIGAGIFTGSAFGGIFGATVGAASAIGIRAYGAYKHSHGLKKESMRELYNKNFADFSTRKSTGNSYANQYAIKEVVSTVIGYRLFVQPLVALVCSVADDDKKNIWWLQLLAYVLRAFEWEFYTAFRSDDITNNMKSPSAATSVLDASETFLGTVTNTVAPQGNFLFDPSQYWDDTYELIFAWSKSKKIKKGTYKNWLPIERDIIKMTPIHNILEQLENSKAKRKYMENQIMRLPKKE